MSSSLLPCNNKPFLNWIVTGDNKLIFYINQWWPAMWLDWEEAPKHFPKSKLHQKKATVTVWWSAANPLQLSESWQNHYIWEVCSANWWDAAKMAMPAASTGQQKGPNSSPRQCPTARHTTNASKVEWIGLQNFASSIIFTWPLVNQPSLLQASWQLFAGKTLPQPAGGRKWFWRVRWILKHAFLCYRNKQTFFFWQKCVDCNGSYFD